MFLLVQYWENQTYEIYQDPTLLVLKSRNRALQVI